MAVGGVPVGGALEDGDFAALVIDENRGREAEGHRLVAQALEEFVAGVGIEREIFGADFIEEFAGGDRAVRADIEADGDHFEIVPAIFFFQRIEERHFLAAGGAPGGPEIDQELLAGEIGKGHRIAIGILEGDVGIIAPLGRGQKGGEFAGGGIVYGLGGIGTNRAGACDSAAIANPDRHRYTYRRCEKARADDNGACRFSLFVLVHIHSRIV